MRLLPKSIHWCRRYPTKFNSGRDIPLIHSLCDTHLQSSDFATDFGPIDLRPFHGVVSGCTGRSRLLLSHLRRFSTFSRNGTPVGRGHALHRGRMPPIFALSHFPCSIRLITKRLLLFPTFHCRSSIGLPYGRLAMRCTWRSNDFSTFHVIAFSDNLGGTSTPVALRSRAGNYETCNLATHANTRKHACDLLAPVGLPH